jgi:hypothetical protein
VPAHRTVGVVICPDHRGSTVQGWGRREVAGRSFQRYRCRSASKSGGTHYFVVPFGEEALPSRPAWQPSPRCPEHPRGRVVRDGHYGSRKAGRVRQRYRCHHGPDHTDRCEPGCEGKRHTFTPPLARRWIAGHGFADACDICEQPRGVHHGEPNAARHHSFTSQTVAAGLIRLSGGDTYGEVGQWALRSRRGRKATRSLGASTKRPSKARSDNAWHIAADWVECFAPVFWRPLDAALRTRALAERRRIDADLAAGGTLRKPLVWIADEMPIGRGGDTAYMVLLVAESTWPDDQDEPLVRLRLARAMPDRTHPSWLLVWDELAGPENIAPDFLVADHSQGLLNAARSRLGERSLWVPSVFHVANTIRGALAGKPPNEAPTAPWPVERHLGLLTRGSPALASVEAWSEWWRRLDELFVEAGGKEGEVEKRRKNYEPPFAKAIPQLAGVWVPMSNAAIEAVQRIRLRRLFEGRGPAFTSIERLNALLDLAVAREHGLLDSEAEVARRLREDAHTHGGWATAPRSINDPANPDDPRDRYLSLRDPTLPQRLVYARGLA